MKKTTKEYLGSLNNRRIISRKTVSPPPPRKNKNKIVSKENEPTNSAHGKENSLG